MAYQIKIPIGMLFKTMKCCRCGEKLKKEKISKTTTRGDADFERIFVGVDTVILDNEHTIDRFV